LFVLKAGNWNEIDATFAALVQRQAGAANLKEALRQVKGNKGSAAEGRS
jgi:hypothetical protein